MLIAKETGTDTYTFIDAVVHKMERQLKKAKEKQRTHKAPSVAEIQGISPLSDEEASAS
jgi:ribosome-associated translation inhibitor RaiA